MALKQHSGPSSCGHAQRYKGDISTTVGHGVEMRGPPWDLNMFQNLRGPLVLFRCVSTWEQPLSQGYTDIREVSQKQVTTNTYNILQRLSRGSLFHRALTFPHI